MFIVCVWLYPTVPAPFVEKITLSCLSCCAMTTNTGFISWLISILWIYMDMLLLLIFIYNLYVLCRSVVSDPLGPVYCSPPGSSVHGIFQAGILEWVAISYSNITFTCVYYLPLFVKAKPRIPWVPYFSYPNFSLCRYRQTLCF